MYCARLVLPALHRDRRDFETCTACRSTKPVYCAPRVPLDMIRSYSTQPKRSLKRRPTSLFREHRPAAIGTRVIPGSSQAVITAVCRRYYRPIVKYKTGQRCLNCNVQSDTTNFSDRYRRPIIGALKVCGLT